MIKSEYAQFAAIWTQAYEVYEKKPSDGAIDMAFAALERFDIGDIRRALTAHINDADQGRFTPKPADVVRHIDGDPKSRSLSAWTKVIGAISGCGPWPSVAFDDPIIHVVIEDMGGWIALCEITDKDEPFKRNEFATRYAGYIGRPPETYPAKLIGMSEAHNAGEHAEFVKPPMLIGDAQKALGVIEQGGERKQLIHNAAGIAGRIAGQLTVKQGEE